MFKSIWRYRGVECENARRHVRKINLISYLVKKNIFFAVWKSFGIYSGLHDLGCFSVHTHHAGRPIFKIIISNHLSLALCRFLRSTDIFILCCLYVILFQLDVSLTWSIVKQRQLYLFCSLTSKCWFDRCSLSYCYRCTLCVSYKLLVANR